MKNHLVGTYKRIKPWPKLLEKIAEECKKVLEKVQTAINSWNIALEEIQVVATKNIKLSSESGSCPTIDNLLSKARGMIYDFVITQARQVTLNSKWRERGKEKSLLVN